MLQDYSEHLRKLRDQLALTPTSVPLEHRPATSSYRSPSTQSLLDPRTFEEERSQLLSFARLPNASLSQQQHQQQQQHLSAFDQRPVERQSTSEKYKEILREVERLSDTVASLHRERSEVDEQWAQRIRQLRAELDAKDQMLDEATAKRQEVEHQLAELKAVTATVRKELQRQSREVEECKTALAAGQGLRLQLDDAQRELEHRTSQAAGLEQQLRERDMQFSAVAAAAAEWEKRYNQAARSRANEVEDVAKVNKRLGEAAKSALHWTGQLLHALSKLGEAVEVNGDEQASLYNALSLLEAQLDEIGNANAQDLQHSKSKVSNLVNECIETVHRRFIFSLAKLDTAASEAAHLKEMLRRSEAKCEQMSHDLSQFVSTADDQSALIDKLRRREIELMDAVAQLQAQLAACEGNGARERVDLEDQIESQGMELHQQRMRINELEANITRLTSQRHLLQEDTEVTISQLRQSLQHKDAALSKMKLECDALRSEASARALSRQQVGDESSIISVEEVAAPLGDSALGAEAAMNTEKSQLMERLATLERTAQRLKEERDAAIGAKDNQERLIMRQEETIVDLVSRLKDGTPPPLMRVGTSKTPSRPPSAHQ